MDPSVMQENRFAVFKFKGTVRAQMIKYMTVSDISIELLIFLHPNLVWWHLIMSWIVFWKKRIALLWSRSRSQERLRIPVTVQLNDISSTAEAFVTRLGMVMHHYGPECHARKWICCLQVQGHGEGSNDQTYDCFWHICWTADLCTPKFSWMAHHHKLERCAFLLSLLCVSV